MTMKKEIFNQYTSSTKILIREAEKRNIKIDPIIPGHFVKFTYKNHNEYVYHQIISRTSAVAVKICYSKDITKKFLQSESISVAKGQSFDIDSTKKILEYIKQLKYPLIIKPLSEGHGNDVFLNIMTPDQLRKRINNVKSKYKHILIEEQFFGDDYRFFTTKDRVVAITKRVPANIIGDGKHTIEELIDLKNKDPRRGDPVFRSKTHVQIVIDNHVLLYLKAQNLSLKYIPKIKETIYLRKNANISTGGDAIDFTDIAHKDLKRIAIKCINAIPGLIYGGVDIMTTDITKKPTKKSYVVLEINSSPGFNIHHFPLIGKKRNVAGVILDEIFPETKIKNDQTSN